MSSRVNFCQVNWKAMIYYMHFIQHLIIRCTVSEILAEIDHKGPNWTFRTLKMIPYLSYFRTRFLSQQRSYMMYTFRQPFVTISWQLINIIRKILYTRNNEKLSDHFWENWQKVAKQQNYTVFGPFGALKNYL